MPNVFEYADSMPQVGGAVIKVIGVGGGGGNAVEHMVNNHVEGVSFISANTDRQALEKSHATVRLPLGQGVTRGLGAGANPEVGRQAAVEDRERIREVLDGADMVFITAGMGGGTGTGGAPVVAEVAREMGILTVGVVTKPFAFEGPRRMKIAEEGIENLAQYVDSLITIPNANLLAVLGKVPLTEAFKAANAVLQGAVQGIADMIQRPGVINVDFADVRTVMAEQGLAMMGRGSGKGDDRARIAAEMAIQSPLLDNIRLDGARGLLVSVAANESLGLDEFTTVNTLVQQYADPDATVVIGTVLDPELDDELRVTVVATGLSHAVPVAAKKPVLQPVPPSPQQFAATGTDFDRPAYERRQENAQPSERTGQRPDLMNIPAFLRRQAD